MKIQDELIIREDIVIKIKDVRTNRSFIHEDTRNPPDTEKLQKLIINYVEQNSPELDLFIDDLVTGFVSQCSASPIFYRGVDRAIHSRINSNKIGPSPNSSDGRYNRVGEKCIYLIDTEEFLHSELKSSSILVQKFNVPINSLKIADLSTDNKGVHNSLSMAFAAAESGMTISGYPIEDELKKRGKSRYLVSQLLASSFIKHGWEGLFIPGVHGNSGQHYHNLVIFGAVVDDWENWAEGPHYLTVK